MSKSKKPANQEPNPKDDLLKKIGDAAEGLAGKVTDEQGNPVTGEQILKSIAPDVFGGVAPTIDAGQFDFLKEVPAAKEFLVPHKPKTPAPKAKAPKAAPAPITPAEAAEMNETQLLAHPPLAGKLAEALAIKGDKAAFAALPEEERTDLTHAIKLAGVSEQMRQTIVRILEKAWPAVFAKYQSIKRPVPGVEPTIEQRHAAYEFAFRAFLRLTYPQSLSQ